MKRSRFSEEQVSRAAREVEAGVPVADLCRKLAVQRQRWQSNTASGAGRRSPATSTMAMCPSTTTGSKTTASVQLQRTGHGTPHAQVSENIDV